MPDARENPVGYTDLVARINAVPDRLIGSSSQSSVRTNAGINLGAQLIAVAVELTDRTTGERVALGRLGDEIFALAVNGFKNEGLTLAQSVYLPLERKYITNNSRFGEEYDPLLLGFDHEGAPLREDYNTFAERCNTHD
ncbi:MAG TPA: hypothetical protein VJJ52_05090 [Candidatus Nanoarchaeia archaeon]|nr:hypothetical protein [Candidatus Nanoarchaeia archaeon]